MSTPPKAPSSVRQQMRSSASAPTTFGVMRTFISQINATTGLSLEVDEQGTCILESAEGIPVVLTQHEQGINLLFTAKIGPPLSHPSAKLLQSLLVANANGSGTQGGWLCLMPGTFQVLYQFDWRNYQTGNSATLNTLLNSFITHAHHLRDTFTA